MSDPVRVVYFSDSPWVGGAERYLHLLAANLPRDEFEPRAIVNGGERLEPLRRWMRESGIEVVDSALDLPRSMRGIGSFVRAIRASRADILHCNLPGPWGAQYSLVAPLARLAGARAVVSTEHLPMVPSFAKGRLVKSAATLAIDRVITVSEDNVEHLVRNHHVPRRKIRVVRNGIPDPAPRSRESARAALGARRDDFLCLIAASLEERKGHATAFAAVALLPERVKLLVAGAGPLEAACRERAAAADLRGRAVVLGHRDDVASLLAACDALLVPSFLEATPYVIIEAMAAGRPVVASRIYGIPELVAEGETGLLVEPGRVEELAQAVRLLAGDSDLVARLGRAGRARFERMFRIDRCVAETVAVYRELISADVR